MYIIYTPYTHPEACVFCNGRNRKRCGRFVVLLVRLDAMGGLFLAVFLPDLLQFLALQPSLFDVSGGAIHALGM